MQKALSAAVLAGPMADVGDDPPSMMAAMGKARGNHRPGTLLDSGATHRIKWVDAEDTNVKYNDELHLAVGYVPCKNGVGDKGIPAVTVHKQANQEAVGVLPVCYLVAQGCFSTGTIKGPISERLETSGSPRQPWNTCRC